MIGSLLYFKDSTTSSTTNIISDRLKWNDEHFWTALQNKMQKIKVECKQMVCLKICNDTLTQK